MMEDNIVRGENGFKHLGIRVRQNGEFEYDVGNYEWMDEVERSVRHLLLFLSSTMPLILNGKLYRANMRRDILCEY